MSKSSRSRILGSTALNRAFEQPQRGEAADLSLLDDEAATTAVEFALVVPVLLLLLGASVETANIMAIERKVSLTTQALVDMSARYAVIGGGELNELQTAARLMMQPYESFSSVIASVVIDDDGVPLPDTADGSWQLDVAGTNPFSVTELTEATSELNVTGDTVMVARVTVNYQPIVYSLFPMHPTISDLMVMRPRIVASLDSSTPTLPPAPPPPP
ncbi:MAG: pilus assembly protein, partial [Geminicoccaceae bacterium]|nr:pilus assembly protein [Geminicoccaceae bacterium]